MNTLIWQGRRIVRRIGAAGMIGLACFLAAWALFMVETLPARSLLAEQTRHLGELRTRATDQASRTVRVDPTPRPLAELPPTSEAAEQIGTLERLARAHGISLVRGQYSATPQPGTSYTRWQIILPVESSYPALHAWLATLLERMPNLVLDELKLKRERIESASLQAEVRLSLYAEGSP